MAVIFAGSTDLLSTRRTSRFIGPLLRWLWPTISPATLESVQTVIRKSGHVAEYAVLALLVWRARRQPVRHERRPWNPAEARFAWLLSVLYAVSDEYHQSCVPSRQFLLGDVFFDALGAALGLLLLWGLGRWRGHWQAITEH